MGVLLNQNLHKMRRSVLEICARYRMKFKDASLLRYVARMAENSTLRIEAKLIIEEVILKNEASHEPSASNRT